MAAIVTALGTIKTTAGYSTNLGNSVKEFRTVPVAKAADGLTVYDRGQENVGSADQVKALTEWRLEVMVDITYTTTSAQNIRKAIADVYKAIGVDDTYSGKAHFTVPVNDEMNLIQEEKKVADARIIFHVYYRTTTFADE